MRIGSPWSRVPSPPATAQPVVVLPPRRQPASCGRSGPRFARQRPSCTLGRAPIGWRSAPEATLLREGPTGSGTVRSFDHSLDQMKLRVLARASTPGSLGPDPVGGVLLENRTEDEKASAGDHRNRQLPALTGTLGFPMGPSGLVCGSWTSRDRSPCNSGDVPNPHVTKAENSQRRAPLSRLSNHDRRRCLRAATEISTESLILAQDERWRRA